MLDAVLDVGGVYDPSRDRYDHHQKGFNEVFGHGFTTKLSASGLAYKHYGMEIIAHQLQLDEGDQNVRRLFIAVYKNFVEAIDAIDNGINQYDTDQPPKYANTTSLSSRIARLNLDWMDHDQTPERENEAFQHAMTLAGSEYLKNVQYHAKSWLPARSIVMEYLSARWITDPSGEIMTLYTFCPTIDACKVLILLLQAHFPLKLKEVSPLSGPVHEILEFKKSKCGFVFFSGTSLSLPEPCQARSSPNVHLGLPPSTSSGTSPCLKLCMLGKNVLI